MSVFFFRPNETAKSAKNTKDAKSIAKERSTDIRLGPVAHPLLLLYLVSLASLEPWRFLSHTRIAHEKATPESLREPPL
jgi:hypothetical protein